MSNENLALVVVGSFLTAGLLYFSVRQLSSNPWHHPRAREDGGSVFLGGTFLMDFGYWMFSPLANILVAWKVSPNFISLFCLMAGIAAGIAFAVGAFSVAGWIWIFSAVMDALDGVVARRLDRVTRAGSVIDSTVDRVVEMAIFFGLAFYYREQPFCLIITFLASAGSILTSYLSAKGDILKIKLPRGWMRRGERAVYISVAALFSPLLAGYLEPDSRHPDYHLMLFSLSLIAAGSLVASAYRLWWLCRYLESD